MIIQQPMWPDSVIMYPVPLSFYRHWLQFKEDLNVVVLCISVVFAVEDSVCLSFLLSITICYSKQLNLMSKSKGSPIWGLKHRWDIGVWACTDSSTVHCTVLFTWFD